MQKLLNLADRCEQASGPDRRLDVQVHILLHPDEQTITGHKPGRFPQKAIYGPLTTFWEWATDESKEAPPLPGVLPVTASIDAAMTLVPEGWEFIRLERGRTFPGDPRGDCVVFEAVLLEPLGEGYSKTTALTQPNALAAAALRALSSQTPREETNE